MEENFWGRGAGAKGEEEAENGVIGRGGGEKGGVEGGCWRRKSERGFRGEVEREESR